MTEFTNKTKEELLKALAEKRVALRNFRTSLMGGKAKNVKEGHTAKKDIARIMTALNAAPASK
jgi:ribosomal protein L29